MQPYLFPYIGYFQLIAICDGFVIHDDVQFIKAGWINRNNFLFGENPKLYTFSVKSDSYESLIKNRFFTENFEKEKAKFLNCLNQYYKKAPHFLEVSKLVEEIFKFESKNVNEFVSNSIQLISKQLHLSTSFTKASSLSISQLSSQNKVIEIVQKLDGFEYYNMIGGVELYSKDVFAKNGITLKFVKPILKEYKQNKSTFSAGLSIIDVLMFNDDSQRAAILNSYELI